MCREAARLSKDGKATLVIGYLRGYSGQELHLALEEAHLMIIAGQGFMSVEGVKKLLVRLLTEFLFFEEVLILLAITVHFGKRIILVIM